MTPEVDHTLRLSDNKKLLQVEHALKGLTLDSATVSRVRDIFISELEKGLRGEPSSLQMENTYISEMPNRKEHGDYLSMDLGGTNLRVCLIQLSHGSMVEQHMKHFHVAEQLRLGPGVRLFDYLASCIHNFLRERGLTKEDLPLGFTFSFPMTQRGLDVGILVSWTKSYNCSGVTGQDAVRMLNDAIHRRDDLAVDVVAILNDTTGTLIQGAFLDQNCAIGVIIGTGCNGCYIERADKIIKWKDENKGDKEVVIDVEWGAFGDNGVLDFLKTDFDREVDSKSLLVNSFTFEKYLGGKYLGEIVRVVLHRLTLSGLLFGGIASEKLQTHGAFTSQCVSIVEEDALRKSSINTTQLLDDFDLTFAEDDIAIVQHVCSIVSSRAAQLVSICIGTLLHRMDKPNVTIAVDGSLYKFHPRLHTLMIQYIAEMAPNKKFKLMLVEDGSGKGAGLVAAIAKRLKDRSEQDQ